MESLISEDLFNLPMVLDSSDINGTSLQPEGKEQSVPFVIFENGDFILQTISDSPLLLSNSLANDNILSEDDVFEKVSQEAIDDIVNKDGDINSIRIATDSDNSTLIEDFVETIVMYKCRLCSFKSSDKESLSSHLKASHLKNSEKEENASSTGSSSKEELSEKLAFMCGKCSKAFASFSDWRSHMGSVHELVINVNDVVENEVLNGGPPIDLETKKKKPKKSNKEVPKRPYVIPKKEKTIPCPVESCLIRLSCRDFVQKHQECHVSPRLFSCPHCSLPFRKWFECANHLWRSHSQDVDLYSCPMCDFKHALRAKLDIHIKIHSEEREYLCNECGKAFKQAIQLQNHRVTHLKVKDPESVPNWSKRQQCSHCKGTFCDSKALKKHIQSVHFNLRPYVCNVCGHTSALKHRMTLHLRQHTGEKPFSCSFCPFVTGDKNCLRRHSWRHARVRPYSCPHCEYSCIQRGSMKKHIQSQHPSSSEVMSCTLCSFTSLSAEALRSHIVKEHSEVNSDKTRVIYISAVNGNNGETGTSQVFALPVEVVIDDEESQNCYENTIIDTGGITIPAEQSEDKG